MQQFLGKIGMGHVGSGNHATVSDRRSTPVWVASKIMVHGGAQIVSMDTVCLPCAAIVWFVVNNDSGPGRTNWVGTKVEFGAR